MFLEEDRQVRSRLATGWVLLLCVLVGSSSFADDAGDSDARPASEGLVFRSAPVTPYRFDGNVRDLPAPRRWKPGDPIREIPRRAYPNPDRPKDDRRAANQGVDPLHRLQLEALRDESTRAFDAPDRNFDGQGFNGINPPDTVGDVGPNHYVQMINASGGTSVQVYDKAVPTPNLLANFNLSAMGLGNCANGFGDPIVLYDRHADRWLLTEFGPTSGTELCMYVSQTSDPTGSYFAYLFSTQQFPDYPKYGVWPTDANGGDGSYIVTTNEASSGVYAMDRGAMLAGNAATSQRFSIPDLPGFSFNAVTPADLDGPNLPPVGTPAVIMRQRDTEAHSGPAAPADVIEMWHFDVDWVDTANTTFTQLTDLDVSEFESDLCGLTAFACFPQPGSGTTLDPLREPIMNRLQYFNFDDHESLVGNFVTDVDGTDRGGLRWFEVRRVGGSGSPWTLHQEGTYSPDGDSRWMAGSAMDQSGNIAIAYNISSTTTFPGLRYTGRLADDPLGVMTQGETVIVDGAGANSSNRYGDYSSMNLDPEDDCTFWFTGEYNPSSSWSTRIASFRFDACGCDLFPSPLSISGGVGGPNQVDLSWNDSDLPEVIEYRVLRSRTMGGPYTEIATLADTSPATANSGSYNYSDTTVSGGIDYYYVVRASDGGACTSDPSNELAVTATGACTLAPLFSGIEAVSTPNSGICTLNLTWSAATPECAGPITYEIYRTDDPVIDPTTTAPLATTTSLSYSDIDVLASGVEYFYSVRARDDSNGSLDANTVKESAVPLGVLAPPIFTDDGGDTGPAQLIPGGAWVAQAGGGNAGPSSYGTPSYGDNACDDLTSPSMTLGIGNTLSFWSSYDIENGWDKGEVQISTDGGTNWTRIEVGYPGSSTNTSDACGLPTGDYFTGAGTAWNQYVADLSPWNNQTVMFRWVLSTDGSVNRAQGWVIDDIEVGNAASACTTASACADNPIVDVTPNGPLGVCPTAIPTLTANLAGGTGPFTYQWYEDGVLIPGATAPSYLPANLGTHDYNARVKAATCPDEVSDGQPTQLDVEAAPSFGGLGSAASQNSSTCSVDLQWNAASSVCPGPLVYDIYRSDTPGVDPMDPNDQLILGVSGTTFSDALGLGNGVDYHYLVRAREASTGQTDANGIALTATPLGPDAIQFSDDAGDTGAAQLTPTAPWSVETTGGNVGPNVYATGLYGNDLCVDLQTPAFTPTAASQLSFWSRAEIENSYDKGEVQISSDGGVNWSRVEVAYPGTSTNATDQCGLNEGQFFTGTSASAWAEYTADLSAFDGQSVVLRWQFSTDGSVNNDGWWVDDVKVFETTTCAPASGGPAPAPDGSGGTTPLRALNLADGVGDTLEVTWDAICGAAGYNLVYGDLSSVASYTLNGSECAIGTSGTHNWAAVPPGNLYFLIVGTDGAGTESSWGSTSGGVERNGGVSSAECGVTLKDPTGTCP